MNIQVFPNNPLQENTYIIWDGNRNATIIDAGMSNQSEKEAIDNFIKTNELQLHSAINTHLHFDHIFGTHFICNKYNIPFIAGREDEFLLDTAIQSAYFFGLNFEDKPQVIDKYIAKDTPIRVGTLELEAIYAPGHSPGSYCFYEKKTGVIFVGDVLFRGSIGRTDLQGGDYDTLISSISNKLFILPDDTIVYPGHGPITTIGHEKRKNPFFYNAV